MKRVAFLLVAVAVLAGVFASMAPASGRGDEEAAPIFVTKIPPGISRLDVDLRGPRRRQLNDLRAKLGNDVAMKGYRESRLSFPDGTIIAVLHYRHATSEENNRVFGRAQSFVPGPPTNIQFMLKDSRKYTATGGWGLGHFQDG